MQKKTPAVQKYQGSQSEEPSEEAGGGVTGSEHFEKEPLKHKDEGGVVEKDRVGVVAEVGNQPMTALCSIFGQSGIEMAILKKSGNPGLLEEKGKGQ